jgi:predicted dehydrogenase
MRVHATGRLGPRPNNTPTGKQEFRMSRYSRRDFLKRTAAGGLAAAGFTIVGTKASGRVLGANDAVRVAVVGINARGSEHIREISKIAKTKNVEIAYLVDPDSRLFPMKTEMVKQLCGNTPKCVQDIRQALEDKDLDAVTIASTNQWHTLQSIWACQAGKDVYVEKPCSHTILEGRKLVEAARKYNRIVQHGSQSRSNQGHIDQVAAVRSGKYGKLVIAYAYAGKPRKSIGFEEPKAPPEGLDFNIWLGPAPQQPYHENLVHYKWHWFWDFGNGEIGNQGPHQFDIARWGMPDGAAPQSAISLGGRYVWNDQGQTANTQLTVYDFGGPRLVMENRDLVKNERENTRNEFYTEEGLIRDGKFFPKGKKEGEPIPGVKFIRDYLTQHFSNFIDCVRSRKREDLHCEILEGHKSVLLAHLGNISYRLGTEVPFSREMKAFGDDKAAYEAFESMKRHLANEAGMSLDKATYRLGRKLTFDAAAEKFVGDEEANKLLTQPYRQPFVVPEQV